MTSQRHDLVGTARFAYESSSWLDKWCATCPACRSFNLPLIITRGNNVYGPHQFPEKLIPKFINQLHRGRPVTLHGNGQNTRNFLFVRAPPSSFCWP
jgi:nucleoside-diphosphate-sugar epimerase